MKKLLWPVFCAVMFAMAHSGPCEALTYQEADQRVADALAVVQDLTSMPDRGIPGDLLRRCKGIAIFPGFVKMGVVLGISYGSGVVLRRDEKTGAWGKPAFFTIRGGSFGLQAGAQSTDLILLIMSEEGVRGLLEDKFTLGADMSVAAGPVGREASAQTDMGFNAGILSYSRSKGMFAGVALKGASVKQDAEANEAYHGQGITAQDVFYEDKGALSDNARSLIKALE